MTERIINSNAIPIDMLEKCFKGLRKVMGLEDSLAERQLQDKHTGTKLPEGLHEVDVEMHNDIDYGFIVDVLRSDAYIRLFEDLSGIKIPEEYRKKASPKYHACAHTQQV